MRRILVPIVTLLALASAAPAQAKWFRGEAVDGPAAIVSVGGASLGRDGRGGVVYVKQEGDNPAGFLARFAAGAWRPPERLPADGVSEIGVAAGDGGRLALAWISGGTVFGAVVAGGPAQAVSAPVPLSAPAGASGLDVEMGAQGGAYAVWSEAGGDVRAARLVGTTWEPLAGALDIDPAHAAGVGAGRPRVAVAADDTAVVAWGETLPDGLSHVFYRRLLGTTPSLYPQEASVPGLGAEAGGSADTPEIDVEYDRSFAWVSFRQDLGGRSRTLMRRLRGSTFDAPVAIDGGATSTGASLAMSFIGEGVAIPSLADNSLALVHFADKTVQAPLRLDRGGSAAPQTPVGFISERHAGAVAYARSASGAVAVLGRTVAVGRIAGPETLLSHPTAGPALPGSLRAAGDRDGDVAVAMLQGAPGARTLTAALLDDPPGRPVVTSRRVDPAKSGIRWNAGLDLLGPQRFTVRVDRRVAGRTSKTSLRVRGLRKGRHTVQVVATDRRGQSARSRTRTIDVVRR